MKLLVISDSHGNIQNLKHALGFGQKIGVGAVIHCGDWDSVQSVEAVLESKIPLYTVLGNADISEEIGDRLKVLGKNHFNPVFLKIKLGGKKILVSHYLGKLKKEKSEFDIGFYGHRHSQEKKEVEGKIFVRPGALEGEINFAIYETDTGRIEFVNDKV